MEIYAIIWTKSAELDLESIIEYIKLENKEIAKKIFFEIKNECQKLHYFPYRTTIFYYGYYLST
jgi:plasmid stabilization system protein ParE